MGDDVDPPDGNRLVDKSDNDVFHYWLCLGKIEANLSVSARSIRGGEPEPMHGCAPCDGKNSECPRYHGMRVARAGYKPREYNYLRV